MKQKVLIIDDSPSIHALVRARLTGENIDIISAADGNTGVQLAIENLPDLILLDVEMPDPNGFEVCRRLKADVRTLSAPVIFLTGASSTNEKIKGLELGALDYITKPFEPAELRARVRGALKLKYLLDLLGKKAQIDGLTGLWNRQHFDERLEAESALARRYQRPFSVLIVDIDHFKRVNDTYGHPFGDEVIRRVSAALTETVRTEDILCRQGGEEFTVIAPNTEAAGAFILAERIRTAVESLSLSHKDQPVKVTCSIGVADFASAGLAGLLEASDQALYRAKAGGRNRVCAAAATPAAA